MRKEKCVEHILARIEDIADSELRLQEAMKKCYPNNTVFLRREIATNEPAGTFKLSAFIFI